MTVDVDVVYRTMLANTRHHTWSRKIADIHYDHAAFTGRQIGVITANHNLAGRDIQLRVQRKPFFRIQTDHIKSATANGFLLDQAVGMEIKLTTYNDKVAALFRQRFSYLSHIQRCIVIRQGEMAGKVRLVMQKGIYDT